MGDEAITKDEALKALLAEAFNALTTYVEPEQYEATIAKIDEALNAGNEMAVERVTDDDEHMLDDMIHASEALREAIHALNLAACGIRERENREQLAFKLGRAIGLLSKASERMRNPADGRDA